jgi:RimJ/RimL family protein N-acetyltransferase
VLTDASLTLREVQVRDAKSLLEHLSRPAVSEYAAAPPSTFEGFRRFIRWTRRERRHDRHASFALVPALGDEPVGIIQLWPLDPDFRTLEWGFMVDPKYWGSGLFGRGARSLFACVFDELGAQRLEAWVCADNERGQAALRKLGVKKRETAPHRRVICNGRDKEQDMWSIRADEWHAALASDRGVN